MYLILKQNKTSSSEKVRGLKPPLPPPRLRRPDSESQQSLGSSVDKFCSIRFSATKIVSSKIRTNKPVLSHKNITLKGSETILENREPRYTHFAYLSSTRWVPHFKIAVV